MRGPPSALLGIVFMRFLRFLCPITVARAAYRPELLVAGGLPADRTRAVKVGIAVIDHGAGLGRPAAYLSAIRRGGPVGGELGTR